MNIVEILKYCPKGTKLYSLIDGEVTLGKIESPRVAQYPIEVIISDYQTNYYTKDGLYSISHPGECILFPSKEQRDWSKFRLPVKRGDIMMDQEGRNICIVDKYDFCYGITTFFIIDHDGWNKGWENQMDSNLWLDFFWIPASEAAKKKLFDKLAKAGYKWNADTLELEKIEPKFKPFDKVLVRNQTNEKWSINLFSYYEEGIIFPYVCLDGKYHHCVPYEGHEYLVGTTINPPHMG